MRRILLSGLALCALTSTALAEPVVLAEDQMDQVVAGALDARAAELANARSAQAIATYHKDNPADPVASQVLANNLLSGAARDLQNISSDPDMKMLVSLLDQRAAIGGKAAVAMDSGSVMAFLTQSNLLDSNGALIQQTAAKLGCIQCASLGGL